MIAQTVLVYACNARDTTRETDLRGIGGASHAQPLRSAQRGEHGGAPADSAAPITKPRFARYEGRTFRIKLRGDALLLGTA